LGIDAYHLLLFAHVVFFAYWIGSDFGVFMCGRRIVRDDLSLDERLRVREIAMAIDLLPRIALISMVPIGFTLALTFGSPIGGGELSTIWAASAAWLILILTIHHVAGSALGRVLQKIDYVVRYSTAAAIGGLGIVCLATGSPIGDRWLAAKLVLFAFIILNGIVLRLISARWQAAFDLVRQGGDARLAGELAIKANRRRAATAAITIWVLILATAFLGVVKPF
jgi:hypothetical protein